MLSIFLIISMKLLYIYMYIYILKIDRRDKYDWIKKQYFWTFPVLDIYTYMSITQCHRKNISVQSTLLWIWSSMIAVQNSQLHHLFISHLWCTHPPVQTIKAPWKFRSQVQYKHLKFLIAAFTYFIVQLKLNNIHI